MYLMILIILIVVYIIRLSLNRVPQNIDVGLFYNRRFAFVVDDVVMWLKGYLLEILFSEEYGSENSFVELIDFVNYS